MIHISIPLLYGLLVIAAAAGFIGGFVTTVVVALLGGQLAIKKGLGA